MQFEPLTPNIGAEVVGVDMAQTMSADQTAELRAGLVEHKVLFFRDQTVTQAEHVAFARHFGDLEVHPFTENLADFPEVIRLHNDAENKPGATAYWHSDVTWREEPSLGSILLCRTCPPTGGDTLFANMEIAYELLADSVKQKIDGMFAVHDFEAFRKNMIKNGATDEEIETFNQKYPLVRHPVVRTHPESGRKSLYVNCIFTQYIEGMERSESDALLQQLYRQAWIPHVQCRFKWQANSVAFWDNRAAQHHAVGDYFPHSRTMERVTVVGERPH
ncbi:MAG: taurine dioxygenase [Limisphaerales bacterium]|jgi:taurine dioxygenase